MRSQGRFAQLITGHGQDTLLFTIFVLESRMDIAEKKDSSAQHVRKAFHSQGKGESKSIDKELHDDVTLLSLLLQL